MENESLDRDTRMWAMICHLSALASYVGIPGIIAVIVIWLIKRDAHPYLDYHGRESLNFQITMCIAALVSGVLCLVLIGFLLLAVLGVVNLVLVIIAGIKANDGVSYRYPFCIRFL